MKLNKIERGVTRYQVTFTPAETKTLAQHPEWAPVIKAQKTTRGNLFAAAMLTKRQINDVCDALGVNGREWFAAQGVVS